MQSNILNTFSEDKFRAQAFADYCRDCNDSYAKLIQFIDDLVTTELDFNDPLEPDPVLPEWDRDNISQVVQDTVDAKLAEYGLTGTMSISLPDGYMTLNDLATFIATQTYKGTDVSDSTSDEALNKQIACLRNNLGNADVVHTASVNDVISSIREQFHSAVVLAAAAGSCVFDTAVDRLTFFKDEVQEKFMNVYDDVSNTFTYFKRLISDGASTVQGVMNNIFSAIGINHLADDDNAILNDADVSQYTGANPVASLDFGTALSAVNSVGKVVAGAVAGICNFAWNISKRVFNWVSNKISSIVVNPYDIEVIDELAQSHTADGWCIQFNSDMTSHGSIVEPLNPYIIGDISNEQKTAVYQWFDDHAGNWLKYNLLSAEILFSWSDVVRSNDNITLKPIVQIKPKPLNYEKIIPMMIDCDLLAGESGVDSQVHTSWAPPTLETVQWCMEGSSFNSYSDYLVALGQCENIHNIADLYFDVSTHTEWQMYSAFMFGYVLTLFILRASGIEATNDGSQSIYLGQFKMYLKYLPSGKYIKNVDFLNIFSGYNLINANFNPNYIGYSSDASQFLLVGLYNNASFTNEQIMDDLFSVLVCQRCDREVNPTSYAFIPYRNNSAGFDPARYRVITDAENQAVCDRFINIIAAIVIVAVLGITAIVIVKKLVKKRFWKMTEFISKSDNAMWNGGSLNVREKRKYIRYMRRLNVSSMLTSGLQGSVSQAVSSNFGDKAGQLISSYAKAEAENNGRGIAATNSTLSGLTYDIGTVLSDTTAISGKVNSTDSTVNSIYTNSNTLINKSNDIKDKVQNVENLICGTNSSLR